MKQIKAYLETQKELAYIAWAEEMKNEQPNLFNAKHWLERIVHLELMTKEIKNGEKKRKEKA